MIQVSDNFHRLARGQIIQTIVAPYISFDKSYDPNIKFFTLDESQLDGTDILANEETNPLQIWDLYAYQDYSDRLVSMTLSRSIEFPYTVQIAQADITFDNHDGFFTPNSGSSISQYNLPSRPCRIYAGYVGEGAVPQLVGMTTQMPDINQGARTADYHVEDFLSAICNSSLSQAIDMRDARTDEVLAEIVEQFGLTSSQYSFEQGANIIPFVFFDIGQDAGEAIRKLVQAEGGRFWLDELGVLRFQARGSFSTTTAMTFDEYSILDVRPSDDSQMVNHVHITADIREVQEFQVVYTKGATSAGSTNIWGVSHSFPNTVTCSLSDPCYSVVNPTLGRSSSVSWFTAKDTNDNDVTTGVTATSQLTSNSLIVTFTNTNAFDVYIDEMQLFGEPAKVINVLDYEAYDEDSVEDYGEHVLEITDNQFFQSDDQADLYARYMLYERANYNPVLEVDVKGDFSLMQGDIVELRGEFAGTYVVDGVNWEAGAGYLATTLKLHQYNAPDYFTLDESRLDSTAVLK